MQSSCSEITEQMLFVGLEKIKQQRHCHWNDHNKIKKVTEKVKKNPPPKSTLNRTFIHKAKMVTSWFAIWFPAPVD